MKTANQVFRATTYQQKLATGDWKTFSDRVRRYYKNTCEICRRTDLETNVHHPFYDPQREPWEYNNHEVMLICRGCHEQLHEHLQNFRKFVFRKLSPQSFRVLNGALTVALDHYDPLVFSHALASFVSDTGMVQRYAGKWGFEARKPTEEEKSFIKLKRSMTGRIDVKI